ncbi:MAG: response regulator transcription factor [Elusimicrobia bacterium]|nr:response regulator transcription factor [Elusimicrobiota bacterium]
MPEKTSILVVDDDENVRALVTDLLSNAGYKVKSVTNAFQARGALLKIHPELIVLDRVLPDAEGTEFVKEIRAQEGFQAVPVLFLTARGNPSDKAEGLRSGGDDYLAKPFSGVELIARVEALLRRVTRPPEPTHVLKAKGIIVDIDRHVVEVNGKTVKLSPKEFELLTVFLEKRGRVLSRRFLLERVWGMGMDLRMNVKTVDVAVGRLRTALGKWGERIVAVQAYGYRLDADD